MPFHHRGQHRLAAEERALQNDGHISIPRRLVDLQYVVAVGDGSVVDENVDGTEARRDLANHPGDVGADADVSLHRDRMTLCLRDLAGDFSGSFSMPVDDRDPGALGGKSLCHHLADPRAGTCDYDDPVREPPRHQSLAARTASTSISKPGRSD